MTVLELLGRAPANEHPERWHALHLLRAHALPVKDVVAVDVDSVLYLTTDLQPRTAWLHYDGKRIRVRDEPGFNAAPG